ncbi:NAD-dependent epimerase/dehydratase family protein [Paludisphaera borealis]|uniref:GDP-6-deoxy-D-mannose reductase n=1 Tax=Paludisphaera borealis TaxID=1387353 RepID=A0A1U7CW71_9BACT|nr:NAD-dependent epimerase/dehydratase family protein [Paludisphaera borealis]APW63139.1 GDP-6-deoxy-D-mannose reductase [Paludisphaera borealis]
MATWLITGASGFLGRHALEVLRLELERAGSSSDRIVVLGRNRPAGVSASSFVSADLGDASGLDAAVREIAPDFVIHTAGKTPPATDDELFHANFWATIRLLKALRISGKPARVVLAGSAAELGPVKTVDLPVGEDYPCQPMTAYGRSKWMATVSALAEVGPLEVMVARVFNPIGPGLPESQAFGQFASQLLAPGTDPLPLIVGWLDARRDFIDVRDAARAMVALAIQGQGGRAYHVGTGHSRTVHEGLDALVRLSGRSVRVCIDPRLSNPREPEDSRARIDRIVSETSWQPTIPFEQTMSDLWTAARSRAEALHASDRLLPLPLTA